MIRTTLPLLVQTVEGRDGHGQPKLSKPVREFCAPVRIQFADDNTTVRTDSSATHGAALEDTHIVVVLLTPRTRVKLDSVITILERKLKVNKLIHRFDVSGKLDHYQLECGPWA